MTIRYEWWPLWVYLTGALLMFLRMVRHPQKEPIDDLIVIFLWPILMIVRFFYLIGGGE